MARVLTQAGYEVSGTDQRDSPVLGALAEIGVRIDIGHRAERVAGAGMVIASAAVPAGSAELVAAREAGIPVIGRGAALGLLVEGLRTVAVAGTHGKTTTSGMAAAMLVGAGWDPTWMLGADLAGIGPGGHLGTGAVAVVEADEAYGSFLSLQPQISVITNVEEDHLDYYGTMEALIDAFARFVASTTETVVLCGDDPRALAVGEHAAAVITYGLAPTSPAGSGSRGPYVWASGMEMRASGSSFTLMVDGNPAARVGLRIAGRHNVANALGAAAAGLALGLQPEVIADGLAGFTGASRRFEYRGSYLGADLVDDYAHHPTEIAATLQAARCGPWRRVIAVFQPHLYSRTQSMWRAFAAALGGADVVVVTGVYGAREQPIPGVSGRMIVDAVGEIHPGRQAAYLAGLDEAAAYVRTQVREGDLVLSLGAGDITTLAQRIMAGGGDATAPASVTAPAGEGQ